MLRRKPSPTSRLLAAHLPAAQASGLLLSAETALLGAESMGEARIRPVVVEYLGAVSAHIDERVHAQTDFSEITGQPASVSMATALLQTRFAMRNQHGEGIDALSSRHDTLPPQYVDAAAGIVMDAMAAAFVQKQAASRPF